MRANQQDRRKTRVRNHWLIETCTRTHSSSLTASATPTSRRSGTSSSTSPSITASANERCVLPIRSMYSRIRWHKSHPFLSPEFHIVPLLWSRKGDVALSSRTYSSHFKSFSASSKPSGDTPSRQWSPSNLQRKKKKQSTCQR